MVHCTENLPVSVEPQCLQVQDITNTTTLQRKKTDGKIKVLCKSTLKQFHEIPNPTLEVQRGKTVLPQLLVKFMQVLQVYGWANISSRSKNSGQYMKRS